MSMVLPVVTYNIYLLFLGLTLPYHIQTFSTSTACWIDNAKLVTSP